MVSVVRSTNAHFHRCLSIGVDFELNVAQEALRRTFSDYFVYNMQVDPNNPNGPAQRAYKGYNINNIVMPDFQMIRNKETLWVDAKWKKSPMVAAELTRAYTPFVSIDLAKHNQYKNTMEQLPGELLLCFGTQGKIYVTPWLAYTETFFFPVTNKSGPVYYLEDMTEIGTYDESQTDR